MLRNSFKFGFELEAFASMGDYYDEEYRDECCNYLNDCDDERLRDFYDNITYFFKRKYDLKGFTHYDGSVKNFNDGYNGFEWSSPILEFNPTNLLKVKKLLLGLNDNEIYINETCGFHTHFSYDGINDGDAAWILLYIATNPYAYLTFTEFEYKLDLLPTNVHFYNERYANKEYLNKIAEYFEKRDYESMITYLCDDKYRVLRIHPQGTLEWRGPREFLYSRNGVESYIKRLYEVVDVINSALTAKEIKGVTREEFLENLKDVRFTCYDTSYKPELTLVDKRTHRYGIMGWFGNYRCRSSLASIERMVNQIIEKPELINDKKFSDYSREIVITLNNKNQLRYVIEQAYKKCGKINVNVQYVMLSQNITLLPYLQDNVWKYLPESAILQLTSSSSFNVESNYKHKTLDYIVTQLPKHYRYGIITNVLKFLTHKDWVVKYLLTNHMERVDKILRETINYDEFDSEMQETFIKSIKKMFDKMLKEDNEDGWAMRRFRDLCDACLTPRDFLFKIKNSNMDDDPLVRSTLNDIRMAANEYITTTTSNWGSITGTISSNMDAIPIHVYSE